MIQTVYRVLAAVVSTAALVLASTVLNPASAEPGDGCGRRGCPSEDPPPPPPKDSKDQSSGTRVEQTTTPKRVCSVYASGAGMGSYCVTPGASGGESLRERFGDQKLQLCRYRVIPENIPTPYNARPDEGRYMLMMCMSDIDFDTYSGGRDKKLDLSVVFVPFGTDIEDRNNELTRFLWRTVDNSTQLPVPIMQTKPAQVPVVGTPTFFTFRWVDPTDRNVVAQGPFEGRANGGPFREITTGDGFVMRARATGMTIDVNQRDVKAIRCDPTTPYRAGQPASAQPEGACKITFPRSSASARKYATDDIPSNVKDAFYASISVRWEVQYGESDGPLRDFGDGFTMRMRQVLPVQEIQTPNQPPTIVY